MGLCPLTTAAIGLLILSAFVHATWNLIGKRNDPSARFFLAANTTGIVLLSPVVLANLDMVARYPRNVWVIVAITGLFQAIYFTGLAGAYKSGHLSVAYPLARSTPVLMVAFVSALMGRANQLSAFSIVGMVLIAVGGLLLPIRRFSDWKLKDYLHASTIFALMAAIGTTGYSIADDSALRALKESVDANKVVITLSYAFFEGVSTFIWLGLILLITRDNRGEKPQPLQLVNVAVAGFGICLAYTIVLLAMTLAKNVSYVVAFRQLSIPIGAMFGVTILREPYSMIKFAAITIMLTGLVLVAVF